jgi:hypothetical protein
LDMPKDSNTVQVTYKQAWASKTFEQSKVSQTSTATITFNIARDSTEASKVRSLLEGSPMFVMGNSLVALTPAPSETELEKTGQRLSGRVVEWFSGKLQGHIEKGAGPQASPLHAVSKALLQKVIVATLSSALEAAGVDNS